MSLMKEFLKSKGDKSDEEVLRDARRRHDALKAISLLETITEKIADGYHFNDELAPHILTEMKESIEILRTEIESEFKT